MIYERAVETLEGFRGLTAGKHYGRDEHDDQLYHCAVGALAAEAGVHPDYQGGYETIEELVEGARILEPCLDLEEALYLAFEMDLAEAEVLQMANDGLKGTPRQRKRRLIRKLQSAKWRKRFEEAVRMRRRYQRGERAGTPWHFRITLLEEANRAARGLVA